MASKKLPGTRVSVDRLVLWMVPPTSNWMISSLVTILRVVPLRSLISMEDAKEEEAHCLAGEEVFSALVAEEEEEDEESFFFGNMFLFEMVEFS